MHVDADSLSPEDFSRALDISRSRALKSFTDLKRDIATDPSISSDIADELLKGVEAGYKYTLAPDYEPTALSVTDFFDDRAKHVFNNDLPTDSLVGTIHADGVYDGVLSRNVFDGGGGQLPPTDTFAFLDTSQAKSDRNLGTFSPNLRDILRTAGPAMLGGGALAAAMGRPTGASAATLPSGWVPPSAKAELEGMEPSGWMDPVNWVVDAATAGGGAAMRAGQAALGAAQDWLGEQVPQIPEVPEEYYEAAQ